MHTENTLRPPLDGNAPGRRCPLHYRYSAVALNRVPDFSADVLYVVGGLYGNVPALERVLVMCADERVAPQVVFNGDFNWFDADPENFASINGSVLQHHALRGNVETELASEENFFGCGCGYPEWVPDEVVDNSNRIMGALRATARPFDDLRRRLAVLPMYLAAQVGNVRIAIVHGDAESLAGWSFAHEVLSVAPDEERLRRHFAAANVALFASTHTCLPVVKRVALPNGIAAVVNNGAAGMPNLKSSTFGLLTRIAVCPAPHPSVFGMRVRDLYVDLVKVQYDQPRWLREFQHQWPPGSPAHRSYYQRIVAGPEFTGPISV